MATPDTVLLNTLRPETIAVHGGAIRDPVTRSITTPIYQTVAYGFDSAEHAAALFNLEEEGFRYSRISNPTLAALERRVALLEGGVEAMVVSSGQAALHYALLAVSQPGSNVVATPQLYGTTHTLLAHIHPTFGVQVRFAESDDVESLARRIDGQTRAVFCETVGNPAGNICDIAAIAEVAHRAGVPLIVDNTVATPLLLRPIDHGADIVVHSLTKFMGGQGATLGGAIVDSGRFDWAAQADRFPMLTQPDPSYHGLVYTQHFGERAYIGRCRSVFLRTMGAALSPLSAFLLLQGLETLAVRVDRHVENARKVAVFLQDHPLVAWLQYAGFPDSPYFSLAQKYLGGRCCSLMSFGHRDGFAASVGVYDRLRLIQRAVNLGDVRSLACHPSSTTHRQMTEAQQHAAGVLPETIRLSIGIEHSDDLIADLDQALRGSALVSRSTSRAVAT